MNVEQLFDKQIDTLLQKGYPDFAKKTKKEFLEIVIPLKGVVEQLVFNDVDIESGYLPFVLVVKNTLIATENMMSAIEKDGVHGITKLYPHTSKDFQVVKEEILPESNVYLLVDIDRGKESLNVRPQD